MNYSLVGFERFCAGLVLKDGSTLRLEPFQKRMLRDHFRGVTEEVVIIPKKNGKTTLFAALALYHLKEWPKADVVVVAFSATQAGILFEQAADMVGSPGLDEVFEVRGRYGGAYRQIRLKDEPAARLRVLAADANTADGELPTLALVDELHRHRDGHLYGVLRDGIDARDGRMVTISTAGVDEDSPLGRLRVRAQNLESYQRWGARCYAVNEDDTFALHEWSLRATDDAEDMRVVKRANPLSHVTIEKLKGRREAALSLGQWLRFACGRWTAGEESWLDAPEWDGLRVDIGGVTEGEQVYAAVVYGMNSAIAVAAARPEDVTFVEDEDETFEVVGAAVKAWVFDGKPKYTHLERELLALAETYELVGVAYDPDQFDRSAEMLEARGLPMVEFPQRTVRMTRATATLQRVIHAEVLRHDGDETLRAQVLRSVIKENTNGGRWLQISDGSRGAAAMAVAVHQATQVETPPRRPRIYSLTEVS